MQTATGLILLGLFMFQGKIVKGKPNVNLTCSAPPDPEYSGQNLSFDCSVITNHENCQYYDVSCSELKCTGKSDNNSDKTVRSEIPTEIHFEIPIEIHNVTVSGNDVLKIKFACGVDRKFPFNVTVQAKPGTQQSNDSAPPQTNLYVGLSVGALAALMVVALIIYGIRRARRQTPDYEMPSQALTV